MTRFICTLIVTLIAFFSFAQNSSLTKGETVKYLQKKIMEVNGHEMAHVKNTFRMSADFVSLQESTLTFTYGFPEGRQSVSFNPSYIKEFKIGQQGSTTGWLIIVMPNKSVVRNVTGSQQDLLDVAYFPYLIGDGTNVEKLKKAFLHLQALLKAEDDPFN